MMSTDPAELSLPRLSYRQAAMAVELRALVLCLEWKAGFRPEQPRVPAGNPGGGQWVGDGSESRPIRISHRGPRGGGQVRILGRWQPVTPAQEARLAVSIGRMQEALLRALQLQLPRTGIGPYAKEWIVAPRTNRRLTRAEQAEIDRIGRTYGCHWCGIKTSGTTRGHFIGDHQVPKSLGKPSRIYPHCWPCSKSQGGLISQESY